MDPYDFAAARLPSDTRAAIAGFWEHFVRHADGIDRCFSSSMKDMSTDPTEVMAALGEVSPDLMWEFGPSDRGHALAVTAEWRDEQRPLARALLNAAPDLPRWRFQDVRTPDEPEDFSAENYEARFRRLVMQEAIEPKLGGQGRIDPIGRGDADKEELGHQALDVAAMLLGEAVERDWIGYCEGESRRSGFPGRLRGKKAPAFDGPGFVDRFRGEIARAKAAMPAEPYAAQDPEAREVVLLKVDKLPDDHLRADLFTLASPSAGFARAVLSSPRFASPTFSRHGESFMVTRIERQPDAPLDLVDDRYALEEKLHAALSTDGLGGAVAAGHGQEAVYIDFAVTDVAQGIERVSALLAAEGHGSHATLHFLDKGVDSVAHPVLAPSRGIH